MAVEADRQITQRQLGPFEPALAGTAILVGLEGATHPHEPEPIVGPREAGTAAEHIGGIAPAPMVREDGDRRPAHGLPAQLLAKAPVLPSGSWSR